MKKIFTLITLAVLCAATAMADDFDTWSVVGSNVILNGDEGWAISSTANDMSTEDGVNYTLTVTGKTLEAGTNYEYKYAKSHAWTTSVPQSGNLSLSVTETAVYTIVYKVNVTTGVNSAETTKTGEAGAITHTYSVAGDNTKVFGASWDPALTTTDMTKGGDDIYTWTKENVDLAAGTIIKYKVVEDHSWGVSYPAVNAELTISETASYDITFSFNPTTKEVSATATKVGTAEIEVTYYIKHPWGTGDNNDWTVKELTIDNGDGTYSVGALYGGTGCNWGTDDNPQTWVAEPTLVGDPAVGDSCVFTLDPNNGTITITKVQVPTTTFTVTVVGCENGYVTIGEQAYYNGDQFESATNTPAVNAGHVVGYTVSAPVVSASDVTVTYEEVGTVKVTVKITNETGEDLCLFAAEGEYWDKLNGAWPGTAFVDNETAVMMTKGAELHLIIANADGTKQTDNIYADTFTEDATLTYIVRNNTEEDAKPYVAEFVTSDIASVKTVAEVPTAIYSIVGQRLAKAQRGVNIVNGRKVVMK